MQDFDLRIGSILDYAAREHPEIGLTSRDEDGELREQTYVQTQARVARLTGALQALGLPHQSRIASLAFNTRRHFELYYGVTNAGHVLHTINPRFNAEQILFTVAEAEDTVIFFDPALLDLAVQISVSHPEIKHFIALCDDALMPNVELPGLQSYESLLKQASPSAERPGQSERDGAFLCYTSGTTGDPKGVLYSHRSCMIHALAAGGAGNFNIGALDVVMPCASMYHATAWALPMITPMNGARLVLPGAQLDGATLVALCQQQEVTLAWGVPTIWKAVLDYAHAQQQELPTLARIYMGGSAVPAELKRAFWNQLEVEVVQVWGMTETSPLGVIATPSAQLEALTDEEKLHQLTENQGRIPFGVQLKIVDESDAEVPRGSDLSGRLLIKGPWVVNQYFGHSQVATDAQGWFDTGDVAAINKYGYMQITDRVKDIIKSGGEWISSIVIENTAVEHPDITAAAAIGLAHDKWDERPLLLYSVTSGENLEPETVKRFLESRLPKWWVPDDALEASELPLTATGKVDKKQLREQYAGHYKSNMRGGDQ